MASKSVSQWFVSSAGLELMPVIFTTKESIRPTPSVTPISLASRIDADPYEITTFQIELQPNVDAIQKCDAIVSFGGLYDFHWRSSLHSN